MMKLFYREKTDHRLMGTMNHILYDWNWDADNIKALPITMGAEPTN